MRPAPTEWWCCTSSTSPWCWPPSSSARTGPAFWPCLHIGAAAVLALDVDTMVAAENFPLVMWLTLAIWSGVLGLASILTGTLSDERTAKITELHDAYVGVVEVLSRSLNSANPNANNQATKVSLLSQKVAVRMGLPDKEADNIRVAALLQDINDIEVTARVIRKAVAT